MSAGGYYTAGSDTNSAARANQKSVTIDTGTNLAALSPTYANQLIVSTDSTGGFSAGVMYQRNNANTAWVSFVPMAAHDHSASTASAGGTLFNVYADNMGQSILESELISPKATEFFTSATGGTITDDIAANQWRVKCDTGVVANNFAQADFGGIRADFGNPIKFQAKVEQQTVTTSLQARIGTNIEKSNAAVDTTTKSIGFEFCDSTGTTYQLESCNATARSVLNTTQAFNGVHSLKLLYTPSVNIVGQVDATTASTKTDNLPNSGPTQADRLLRFGIMTTNTTVKDLYVYGATIAYWPNDNWTV